MHALHHFRLLLKKRLRGQRLSDLAKANEIINLTRLDATFRVVEVAHSQLPWASL